MAQSKWGVNWKFYGSSALVWWKLFYDSSDWGQRNFKFFFVGNWCESSQCQCYEIEKSILILIGKKGTPIFHRVLKLFKPIRRKNWGEREEEVFQTLFPHNINIPSPRTRRFFISSDIGKSGVGDPEKKK